MGNVVASVVLELEDSTMNRKQNEYVEEVIDLDSENWREKIKECKKIWYEQQSNINNIKDISTGGTNLSLKQESNLKRSNKDELKKTDLQEQEMKSSDECRRSSCQCVGFNEKEVDRKQTKRNAVIAQKRDDEQDQQSIKSRERVKSGFRIKNKLFNRDCNTIKVTT